MKFSLCVLFLFASISSLACTDKIKDALTQSYAPSYIRVGEGNTYEKQKSGVRQVYKYYKAEIVSHNGQPKKVYRAVVRLNQKGCKLDSLKQEESVQFKF